MSKVNAGEIVVQCLEREGVEFVYNVPGESFLPVMDALKDSRQIQLLSTRHESGAGFIGEGYAKASNKVSVVMATRGVGAANASIAIQTAFQDSTPMVFIFGQVERKAIEREGFQEINFKTDFQSFSKWSVQIDDINRIPEQLQKAFRVAQSGRPGPVIVSLPEDLLYEKADDIKYFPSFKKNRPIPNQDEIGLFSDLLNGAKKPIVIAGGGVRLSESTKELNDFLDKYKLPVISGYRRQDFIDHNSINYIGHLSMKADAYLRDIIQESDLIIAMGTRLAEATSQSYSLISDNQKLIHLDVDPGTIGKTYLPDLGIVGDLKETLKLLIHANIEKKWNDWLVGCKDAFTAVSKTPIDQSIYTQIFDILQHDMPADTILTSDTGNFASWINANVLLSAEQRFISSTNGAMGYGMPAALGAKIAFPNRPVISLSGDGGFMMTVQELETSVRGNHPIICIVFNNNMLGTIRMHQELHFPSRVIGTDFENVDFVKIAEGCGARGIGVSTVDAFKIAIKEALEANETTVIDVKCDQEYLTNGKTIKDFR